MFTTGKIVFCDQKIGDEFVYIGRRKFFDDQNVGRNSLVAESYLCNQILVAKKYIFLQPKF